MSKHLSATHLNKSKPKRSLANRPILLGVGVFLATLLVVVIGYGVQFAVVAASEPQSRVQVFYEAQVQLPTQIIEPVALEVVTDSLQSLLADVGISEEQLSELPRPAIDTILPGGLDVARPEDLLPLAATPIYALTPAAATPGGVPVLALENYTNTVIEPITARWTVTGKQDGWVRVIVPVGRGALPSVDPDAVNHQAVWVPEAAVSIEAERNRIEVSLADRAVTVFHDDVAVGTFHVGIGAFGRSETPAGLCSVIARVIIQTGAESLLTSCQSERLDAYAGATWATIALHEGAGFSETMGGAISNGCVRVSPANFAAYLDDLPIGTPVLFTP